MIFSASLKQSNANILKYFSERFLTLFKRWKKHRFAQKQMKSGLRKNGGETGFPPPQGPHLYCSILIPHCQKCFWKNFSIFVDRTKNIFVRIVFRPNIQALEKNVAKMAIFILPHLYWPEMAKRFQKNFWGMF